MMRPSSDWTEALNRFPAIALDEMQEEAAFLTRADRKYLVPVAALPRLLAAAEPHTRILEIDGRRRFGYTTPYFDDDACTAYLSAMRRRPHRFKVRTRLYIDSGLRLLEVKIRDRRGYTVKHRMPHETTALDRLSGRELAWLREFPQVARLAGPLRHRVTTRYHRATLVLPGASGRVTIDRDVTFSLPCGEAMTLPELAIVETKGAGKPTSFDRLLWRDGFRPTSMSKFAAGLSLLLPELPANRWHRVRQRLLAEAQPTSPDLLNRACPAPVEALAP